MYFRTLFRSGLRFHSVVAALAVFIVSGASHAFDVNEGSAEDIALPVQPSRGTRYAVPRRIPMNQPAVPFSKTPSREPDAIAIVFAPVRAGEATKAAGEGISVAALSDDKALQSRSFDPLHTQAPATAGSKAPTYPKVDPEVVAKAAAELQRDKMAVEPAPAERQVTAAPAEQVPASTAASVPLTVAKKEPGYIAPLPLFSRSASPKPLLTVASSPSTATSPVAYASAVATPTPSVELPKAAATPAHIARPDTVPEKPLTITYAPATAEPALPLPSPPVPSATVSASAEQLSRGSKAILGTIPSRIDSSKPGKASKVTMARTDPAMEALDIKTNKVKPVEAYEASGIKISVRRPGLDTNYELNRAFNAMSGGDTQLAMQLYRNILSTEPSNADALFGLASLYHRQGQLDKARPLYGELLKRYPNHREGINNFLVMVSDESPQEALAELVRLEQRNPDFSPIPAQQAIVLQKLGYPSEAQEKMLRAIELAPDNLTYKYNFAVMLDRQGNYAQAAGLYRLLLDASARGEPIPTDVASLQTRLNYIATINTAAKQRS